VPDDGEAIKAELGGEVDGVLRRGQSNCRREGLLQRESE
jgi:hypothetical protein